MKCFFCALIKAAVALVIAVVVALAAYGFGKVAVSPRQLEKNAYLVEMPQVVQADAPQAAQGAVQAAAPVPAPALPLPELLAKADIAAGQKYAKVCAACHSFNKGEAAKMGPNLYGIIGAKHAHMDGFAYSSAMQALAARKWTYEDLNAFLTDPRGTVAGTKMTFAGIKTDTDRANVIAWLRTLADSPEPLPSK